MKRAGLLAVASLLMVGYALGFVPGQALAAACAPPSTDYGTATASIKIDTDGTYQIWSRMMAPDTTNNSYMLEVDGANCYVVGDSASMPVNTWTWVDYQNATATNKARQTLTAGTHTLKMIGREPGVKLARVLLVSDLNCIPTGTGDNCAVAGDSVAPSVNITAPVSGATVSKTTDFSATATDNVGVSKVEFYVNGMLVNTDTAAPYTLNWDTTTVPNGTASLMAKAYDAAGNVNSDTIQVQVANGDSQAPTVPANVTATANAYNKVTVGWTASTDNVGVTGYRVLRGGVAIGQVTSGTQYVDTTTLPNTSYSYQVMAYDAANNTSALSAAATVKTPNQPDSQAPTAPANLQATAVNSKQINLTWTASTDNVGVAAYDIYRAVGSGTPIKVGSVSTLTYGDTGLTANTKYSYYVVARDAAGNISGPSATVTAQTPTTTPTTGKGKLKGKVTYTSSTVDHASVVLRVGGARHIYSTDKNGNYEIDDLPAGTYQVRYTAKGSYTKEVTVRIQSDKTKSLNITLRHR